MKRQKHRNTLAGMGMLAGLLLLCFGCAGSGGPAVTPTPTPAPTPTPTPTPTPVIALWGGEAAPAFYREVERAVLGVGFEFAALPATQEALHDFAPEAAACVIVCCTGEAPDPPRIKGAYYCMLGGASVPAGCYGVRYNGSTAVEKTFSEILAYPPHCEPVRLLGLFTHEESPAYAAYQAACDEGKFFSRGAYFSGGKSAVSEWLSDRLDDIYPGMLDCIFAETGELAVMASDTLMRLNRDDAEIFSASTSGEALLAMQEAPGLIACAVGYFPADLAESCVNNAILSIINYTPTQGTLLPETFYSGGVAGP